MAKRISTGNFTDNMKDIGSYDWVIEVVVERLDIKQQIFTEVEKYRKPGTLITSNTSGIPIHLMAEGRSEDFKKHFCGTHLFNPPRHLRLLEIIPTPYTDPAVIDFPLHYGDLQLGKTTVLAKDTPAFIANRIGVYGIMAIFGLVEKMKLSIDEVDALTGPIIGRPKSATFRTADVVGIDTLVKVAKGVADNCPNDEQRAAFTIPAWLDKMVSTNWLGDKNRTGLLLQKKRSRCGRLVLVSADVSQRRRGGDRAVDRGGVVLAAVGVGDPGLLRHLHRRPGLLRPGHRGDHPRRVDPPDIDATVVRLDEPAAPVRTGRFAGTVAGFWRRGDLDGLDALGELGDDPETAAALLALCRGDDTVSPEEQSAIARLAADGLPEWAWRRLASQAGLLTHDLASAVAVHAVEGAARCVSLALRDPQLPLPVRLPPPGHASALGAEATAALRAAVTPAQVAGVARVAEACDLPVDVAEVESAAARTVPGNQEEAAAELSRVPAAWREAMITGYVAGLEAAPGEISATLCGLFADRRRDWHRAPRTGVAVLRWQTVHGARDRVDVTVELMDRAFEAFREEALPSMWAAQPTPGEISRLVDLLGPRMDASPTLGELPGRAFVKAGLTDGAALELAERVRDGLPGFPADDAEATLIAARLPSAPTPVEAASAIDRLTDLTREGNADLAVLTRAAAAKVLATRDPRFRATVAKSVTDATRRWLIPEWLKPRNRDQRMALLEIAIRMRAAGVVEPRLDAWARSEVHNWGPFSSVEARFKQDAELAAGLKELAGQRRRLFGRGER